MVNIHISLAGEGRGHAARARTLIDHLRQRHRVVVHTFGDAYAFLKPLYEGTRRFRSLTGRSRGPERPPYAVSVREIPGLRFAYGKSGKLDYVRTAARGLGLLGPLLRSTAQLKQTLIQEGADLVITDFEPTLPRAARRVGVPVVALDHQSAFSHGDFWSLPQHLARHARAIGQFVRLYTPAPDLQISSSFYEPKARRPLLGPAQDVHFVGVLLRDAVRRALPVRGQYLLAYLRAGTSQSTIEALRKSPCEVRLYGIADVQSGGAIVSKAVSESGFVKDLAGCRAVVTTAGNQLLGEAIHLGKPVLAMPEPGNKEQEINGWFLERSGAGRTVPCHHFNADSLRSFLASERQYVHAGLRLDVDGTAQALELIESLIQTSVGGRSAPQLPVRAKEVPAAVATTATA
ncbi:MAG: glycosyltransferase family protein [Planctomycetota bacterium]